MSVRKKIPSREKGSIPPEDALFYSSKKLQHVLPYERATVTPSNTALPYTDYTNYVCGRPYGAVENCVFHQRLQWDCSVPSYADGMVAYSSVADLKQPQGIAPLATEEPKPLSRRELRKVWWRYVAQRLPCPLLYPHHRISFRMIADNSLHPSFDAVGGSSAADASIPSAPALEVASVIRRLTLMYISACSVHNKDCVGKSASTAGSPEEDFTMLLGNSLYRVGYKGPQEESKDLTFDSQVDEGIESNSPPETVDAEGGPTLQLIRHHGATHINVCTGMYYYRLEILDPVSYAVMDTNTIARCLEAAMVHAAEREVVLAAQPVSEAVKQDQTQLQSLFARMTVVHDKVNIDLHRRLREVSKVNAYSLDSLEGGLFSVVLGSPTLAEKRSCASQWLHSALSLYASMTEVDREMIIRVHATLASMHTLQRFLHAVFEQHPGVENQKATKLQSSFHSSGHVSSCSPKKPLHRADTVSIDVSRTAGDAQGKGIPPAAGSAGDVLGVEVCSHLQHLEMWLPVKHCVPLRPYPCIATTPSWQELDGVTARHIRLAELCLFVIVATHATFKDEDGQQGFRRPRVFLATHHPESTVPSVTLIYSTEIEEYLRIAFSSSVLVNQQLRKQSMEAAIQDLARLLQLCIACPHTSTLLATDGQDSSGHDVCADVCLSVGQLRRAYSCRGYRHITLSTEASTSSFKVSSCFSDLGIPAHLYITCMAEEVSVQKEPSIGNWVAHHACLGTFPKDDERGRLFCQHLKERLEVYPTTKVTETIPE